MIGMNVSGLTSLRAGLERMAVGLDAAAKANTQMMAAKLIQDAQANFQGSHPKGMPHVGGALPNIVTGTLRRSIQGTGISHEGPGTYRTRVGPSTKYGRRVELGLAPTGAYPYFGPAVKRLRSDAPAIIAKNIARYLG